VTGGTRTTRTGGSLCGQTGFSWRAMIVRPCVARVFVIDNNAETKSGTPSLFWGWELGHLKRASARVGRSATVSACSQTPRHAASPGIHFSCFAQPHHMKIGRLWQMNANTRPLSPPSIVDAPLREASRRPRPHQGPGNCCERCCGTSTRQCTPGT